MDHEDLDRILKEPRIEPGPGFAARVMADVRREGEAPAIAFPWRLAGVGVVAMVLVIVTLALVAPDPRVLSEDIGGARAGALLALTATFAVCGETIRRVLAGSRI